MALSYNAMKSIKQEIEKIELENEELKQELARESRQARMTQLTTSSQNVELERLRKEADSYVRKIEAEKKKISELEDKIAATATGDPHAVRENHRMLTKQIKLLENRLAKALEKFNSQLAKNKKIRQDIDEYRKERVVYDGIYKKLEKELHAKKKEMAAIIEDAKTAYAKHDKAKSELQALKTQVNREKDDFQREWAELGRLIEEDRLLRGKIQSVPERATPVPEPKTVQIVQKPEEKPKTTLTREQVMTYEEHFQKIKKETGVTTMKDLVDLFQNIEEKNFSLFNSINDINSDIETTELTIAETKLEIEKYKGQGVSTDTQRKKILRDLEEKLQRTEAKADEYEAKQQSAQKIINQLKTGIHSIFSRLGCASTSVEEMLGNQGVTEANMMQYLEIIEQRTTDILQTYAASQAAASARADLSSTSPLDHGVVQPAAPRLSVQPPTLDDFSSGDDSDQDDDERPLTREELQRKTLRGLQQTSNKKKIKPP